MLINKRKYMISNNKKILHKIGKSWVVISTILLLALAGGTAAHANTVNQNTNQPQQENSMAHIPVQNQNQSAHANQLPTNNGSQIIVNSASWHSLSPVMHNHPFSNSNNSQAQSTNFSVKSNNNSQASSNNNQARNTINYPSHVTFISIVTGKTIGGWNSTSMGPYGQFNQQMADFSNALGHPDEYKSLGIVIPNRYYIKPSDIQSLRNSTDVMLYGTNYNLWLWPEEPPETITVNYVTQNGDKASNVYTTSLTGSAYSYFSYQIYKKDMPRGYKFDSSNGAPDNFDDEHQTATITISPTTSFNPNSEGQNSSKQSEVNKHTIPIASNGNQKKSSASNYNKLKSAAISASMSESASAHNAFISSSAAQYKSYVTSARSSEFRASSASMSARSASESARARQANSQSNYNYSVVSNPSSINSSLASSSASYSAFISNSVAKYKSYMASLQVSQSNRSKSASVSISASLFSSESASQSESQSIINSIEYMDAHDVMSNYVAPPHKYISHSTSSNNDINHITSENNSGVESSGKANMSNIQPNSKTNTKPTNINIPKVNSNQETKHNSNNGASQQSNSVPFNSTAYNHQQSGFNSSIQSVTSSSLNSVTNQTLPNTVTSSYHQSSTSVINRVRSTALISTSTKPAKYSFISHHNTVAPSTTDVLATHQGPNEPQISSRTDSLIINLHNSQKLVQQARPRIQLNTKSSITLNNGVTVSKPKIRLNARSTRHRDNKLPQTNEVKFHQLLALILLISAIIISTTGYTLTKHHER